MMRYETEGDVKARLYNTVVMYKKRPVLITGVEDAETVVVQDLLTERHSEVPLKDVDLEPSHAPLGYVMHGEDVYLAMRKPSRKFKQGLTGENLIVRAVLQKGPQRAQRVRFNYASKAIGRAILGEYPSIEDAFQKARQGASTVPYHRDWAVGTHDDELSLIFRGEIVGYVLDNSVKLLPERFYLKESLEVSLGQV